MYLLFSEEMLLGVFKLSFTISLPPFHCDIEYDQHDKTVRYSVEIYWETKKG